MVAKIKAEQEAYERQKKAQQARRLAELTEKNLWWKYHQNKEGQVYWEERGIPIDWQDFWYLGYREDWSLHCDDGSEGGVYRPASSISIPIFASGWKIQNIKHRFVKLPEGCGNRKYQYHVSGTGGLPLFLCNPHEPIGRKVVAIEGEIKAMVVYSRLEEPRPSVIGLPGSEMNDKLAAALAGCDEITLNLDPGSDHKIAKFVERLPGINIRILSLPDKIDDLILRENLGAGAVRAILDSAV
jgi:hypothetical protein